MKVSTNDHPAHPKITSTTGRVQLDCTQKALTGLYYVHFHLPAQLTISVNIFPEELDWNISCNLQPKNHWFWS